VNLLQIEGFDEVREGSTVEVRELMEELHVGSKKKVSYAPVAGSL
jgi:hypothetical protein